MTTRDLHVARLRLEDPTIVSKSGVKLESIFEYGTGQGQLTVQAMLPMSADKAGILVGRAMAPERPGTGTGTGSCVTRNIPISQSNPSQP